MLILYSIESTTQLQRRVRCTELIVKVVTSFKSDHIIIKMCSVEVCKPADEDTENVFSGNCVLKSVKDELAVWL